MDVPNKFLILKDILYLISSVIGKPNDIYRKNVSRMKITMSSKSISFSLFIFMSDIFFLYMSS